MFTRIMMTAPPLAGILLAGLLAQPSRLDAGELRVQVRDAAGEPVIGASVQAGGGLGAATDEEGRATLKPLSGRIELLVSSVGYASLKLPLELPREGTVTRAVTLQRADLRLGGISVTTARGSGLELGGTRATESLSAGDAAARAMDGSARSALGSLGGVDTRPCGLCGSAGVGLQGLDPNYTEIRMDGLALLSGVGALYGMDGVSVSSLSSMAVTRGASTVAEGGGAIAGSVSLTSRRPNEGDTLQLRASLGDGWRHGLGLSLGRHLLGWPALLVADWAADPGRLDRNSDRLTDTPQLGRWSGQATVGDKVGAASWSMTASGLGERRFAGDTAWEESDRGSHSVYGRDIRIRRGEVRGTAAGAWSPARAWTLAAAGVFHHQDSWYGPTAFDATQRRLVLQAGLDQRWSGGALSRFQVAWLDDDYCDGLPLETDRHDRVPSLSASHGGMTGPWSWEGGLRLEWQEEGLIPLLRGTLATAPAPDWTLRFSAGQGYRPVTLFSLDRAVHAGFDNIELPHRLKPERSLSLNLGLQHKRAGLSGRWQGDASLFAVEFREKAVLRYTETVGHLFYGNAHRGHSRGLELRGDWLAWSGWHLAAGGTWSRAMVELAEGWRAEELKGAWTASAQAGKRGWAGWPGAGLELRWRATGPQVLPAGRGRAMSPAWSVLDLGLEQRGARWTVGLDVENLLDYVQPDSPLVLGEAHAGMLDSALIYGPLIGRRIRLRGEWNF